MELETILNTTLYGIDPNSSLKAVINDDILQNNILETGVVISDYLHEYGNINIGDEITYLIGSKEVTYEVVGISNELIESNTFMAKVELNHHYGASVNSYNAVYTTDTLYQNAHILSRINYIKGLDEFTSVLNISSMIINIIASLSIIIGLYIFGVIVVLYINENKINIATLQSLGYTNKEINLKYTLGIGVLLIVTYFLSIPITRFLLDLMLKRVMNIIGFKLILSIEPVNIVIGLFFLIFIYLFTTLFIAKYNDKLSISETLKTKR